MHAVNTKVSLAENRYNSGRPNFLPGPTVQESVKAFRLWMGTATGTPLSYDGLADWLMAQGHRAAPSWSTVRRWEAKGSEPDLESVWLMARYSAVPMEVFCGFVRIASAADPVAWPRSGGDGPAE